MGSSQFADDCKLPRQATDAGSSEKAVFGFAGREANPTKNVTAIFTVCGTPTGRFTRYSKSFEVCQSCGQSKSECGLEAVQTYRCLGCCFFIQYLCTIKKSSKHIQGCSRLRESIHNELTPSLGGAWSVCYASCPKGQKIPGHTKH